MAEMSKNYDSLVGLTRRSKPRRSAQAFRQADAALSLWEGKPSAFGLNELLGAGSFSAGRTCVF